MNSERRLAEAKAASGRRCGSCSLCCRLLDVPRVDKPKNDWCPHCRPGKGGCAIYDRRPQVCRGYACEWLAGRLGDECFPPRAKMVVDFTRAPKTEQLVMREFRHRPGRPGNRSKMAPRRRSQRGKNPAAVALLADCRNLRSGAPKPTGEGCGSQWLRAEWKSL